MSNRAFGVPLLSPCAIKLDLASTMPFPGARRVCEGLSTGKD
jgi:hypothetical protein